jgi:hypothetical protein
MDKHCHVCEVNDLQIGNTGGILHGYVKWPEGIQQVMEFARTEPRNMDNMAKVRQSFSSIPIPDAMFLSTDNFPFF